MQDPLNVGPGKGVIGFVALQKGRLGGGTFGFWFKELVGKFWKGVLWALHLMSFEDVSPPSPTTKKNSDIMKSPIGDICSCLSPIGPSPLCPSSSSFKHIRFLNYKKPRYLQKGTLLSAQNRQWS